MYESGAIKPITPIRVFPAAKIEDSFRYMQKGTHLGKIVLTMPEAGAGLAITRTAHEVTLRPSASYLLVGGLGGLGRAVARWLVEKGARHLIFFSRSAGTNAKDQAFLHELQYQGCTTQAIQGSVTNLDDVRRIVSAAPEDRPIRGVMQMSMVLRDKSFLDMDLADWETAVAPKVQGTWNLHHAMPTDLDFFFMTGSISGSFGTPGQANYAAGNTFLNAFTQYRRGLGLAASVLHIGIMEDVGYLAQHSETAEALRAAGGYFLREQDLLDAMDWAIAKPGVDELDGQHQGQLTIGLRCDKPLSDPTNRIIWNKDPRMGLYHNRDVSAYDANTANNETEGAIKALMLSAGSDPSILESKASLDFITRQIGIRIFAFMLQPVEDLDVGVSLAALGVDSLVTIEIRNWIKKSLGGIELSTLEILNCGTVKDLGLLVVEAMKKKFAVKKGDERESDAYLEMKAP